MPKEQIGIGETPERVDAKLAEIEQERDRRVAEIHQLQKEEPSEDGKHRVEQLQSQLRDLAYDETSWYIEKIKNQLAALGNSSEDEAKRAKLLRQKTELEKHKELKDEEQNRW